MSPFQKTVAVLKLLEYMYCDLPQGPDFPVTPTGDLGGKCHGSHPVPAAPLLFHRGRTAQAPIQNYAGRAWSTLQRPETSPDVSTSLSQ